MGKRCAQVDLKPRVHRILFVCLGNICRSPTAEGMLRHMAAAVAPELALEIDSAGTARYHLGTAPDQRAQAAARRRGIELGGLRARQVVPADFTRFDYILAMDRDNLRDLEALRPAASTAILKLFLEYAPGRVGQPAGLEVPDPYYGGEAQFEQVLDLTAAASRGLLETLQLQSLQNGP